MKATINYETNYECVSGMRVSDWCYTGPIDSAPPVVKNPDIYETVRLLGRGSFGEVNLIKNTDDHKL